jgi:hypothetical protein
VSRLLGQAAAGLAADGDGSGAIHDGDYSVWRSHFSNTVGAGGDSRRHSLRLDFAAFLADSRPCLPESVYFPFLARFVATAKRPAAKINGINSRLLQPDVAAWHFLFEGPHPCSHTMQLAIVGVCRPG